VFSATHQHGSYSFYLQDPDTNWWELEVWHDAIRPVARGIDRSKVTDDRLTGTADEGETVVLAYMDTVGRVGEITLMCNEIGDEWTIARRQLERESSMRSVECASTVALEHKPSIANATLVSRSLISRVVVRAVL
jgi:hypothetical protein